MATEERTQFQLPTKKKSVYDEITDSIIELLEEHTLTWNKPWVSIDKSGGLARNASTEVNYTGINQLLLSIRFMEGDYALNSWITFNQAKKLGGRIKKGAKSVPLIYYRLIWKDRDNMQYSEELVKAMSQKQKNELGINAQPMLKQFRVFNVDQCDNLPEDMTKCEFVEKLTDIEQDDRAEEFIGSSGATIKMRLSDRAYYNPISDVINLPLRSQFNGTEAFYETALHELGHWTGHPTRMNREIKDKFGSPEYAFEELVAELFSAFVCSELGFTKSITNNAAYIQSWMKVLENDSSAIVRASSLAQKGILLLV